MEWISQHRTIWRVSILVLALIAILLGPWFLMDTISVPEPHECSYPWVRVDEDFCRYEDAYRLLLFSIPGISLLPVLSTIINMMGRDRKRLQVLNFIIWLVAAGYSLVISTVYPEIYSEYLGIRLFIMIALLALLFELINFIAENRKFRWGAET